MFFFFLIAFGFKKILHENIPFIIGIWGGPLKFGSGPAPEMGPPFSLTGSCPWPLLVQTHFPKAPLSRGQQPAGGHTVFCGPTGSCILSGFAA